MKLRGNLFFYINEGKPKTLYRVGIKKTIENYVNS